MNTEWLGPDLGAEVTWEKTDARLEGPLADLLRAGQWDINKLAHYLTVYESAFGDHDRPARMLEIGVDRGGSLELWRKYFTHPEAVFVGIDANEKCAQLDDPSQHLYVRIGKQQDADFLQRLVEEFGPFDIILDDGSHIPSFTLRAFQYLFLHGLVDGGTYLVEDLHTCYMPCSAEPFSRTDQWYEGANDGSPQFIRFVMGLMDIMHAHYLQTPEPGDMDKFEPGNPAYRDSFQVPLATTLIKSIELHDAIVVIRRGPRELPRIIRRWSRERTAAIINQAAARDFAQGLPYLEQRDRTRQDWLAT